MRITSGGATLFYREIYNKTELRERWGLEGEFFPAMLDCIVKEHYAPLSGINGEFAGAVPAGGGWVLFRDHMGVQPLYFYCKGSDLAFAEDLRELCARPGADLSVNETWLYLEASGANSLSLTETEYQYIQCVRPGSWCEFTPMDGGWQQTEHIYWQPGQTVTRLPKDGDYIAEMRRLVTDAVRIRLETIDGVVGAESSGGLDSSVIDLLIAEAGREARFVSWSVSYDEVPKKPIDERQVVEDVCAKCGQGFHFIPGREQEVYDAKARFLPPFVNTLQISQTSKLMRELGADTVFTGHGGDEGVSHRGNMTELWYHGEYGAYLRELWNNTRGRSLRLLRTAAHAALGVLRDLPQYRRSWQNEDMDLRCCMNPEFVKKMEKTTPFPPLYFNIDPIKYILSGGSRSRMDNCAVQAKEYGVRYLFPFLDYRVVDFAVTIPRHLYRHNGQTRYIYREAFKDLMPQSLYEVNYKDFPSLRRQEEETEQQPAPQPTEEERAERRKAQREWADETLALLDWSRWDKYFDRAACEKLLMQDMEQLDESGQQRVFTLTSKFYTCSLLQNLQDNAGKWAEKQNET